LGGNKAPRGPDGTALEMWSLSGKKQAEKVDSPLEKGRFELKKDCVVWTPSS